MTSTPSPPTQSSNISLKVAASIAQCCRRTLRAAIAQGRLRAYRVSTRIYIRPEDLQVYLKEREVPVAPDKLAQNSSRLNDLKVGTHDEQNGHPMAAPLTHQGAQMIKPTTVTITAAGAARKEVSNDHQ